MFRKCWTECLLFVKEIHRYSFHSAETLLSGSQRHLSNNLPWQFEKLAFYPVSHLRIRSRTTKPFSSLFAVLHISTVTHRRPLCGNKTRLLFPSACIRQQILPQFSPSNTPARLVATNTTPFLFKWCGGCDLRKPEWALLLMFRSHEKAGTPHTVSFVLACATGARLLLLLSFQLRIKHAAVSWWTLSAPAPCKFSQSSCHLLGHAACSSVVQQGHFACSSLVNRCVSDMQI